MQQNKMIDKLSDVSTNLAHRHLYTPFFPVLLVYLAFPISPMHRQRKVWCYLGESPQFDS